MKGDGEICLWGYEFDRDENNFGVWVSGIVIKTRNYGTVS